MHKLVQLRGEQLADDPNLLDESRDIFTRLVAANDEKAKYRLDTGEVVSKKRLVLIPDSRCLKFFL